MKYAVCSILLTCFSLFSEPQLIGLIVRLNMLSRARLWYGLTRSPIFAHIFIFQKWDGNVHFRSDALPSLLFHFVPALTSSKTISHWPQIRMAPSATDTSPTLTYKSGDPSLTLPEDVPAGPPVFEDKYEERKYLKHRLALAFRIFAKFGFCEGIAGHITLRDPVDSQCFWVNPFGLFMQNSKLRRVLDL